MIQLLNRFIKLLILFIIAAFIAMYSGCSNSGNKVIEPVETDELLVNPGMGFTTFYSFNGDERNNNYPECSIAYFRWYWDTLEPEEGKVNFAMIDSLLDLCRERGQKLAIRIMCQNGHEDADGTVDDYIEVPLWFKESEAKGFYYTDSRHWQPDYDDPIFMEKHGNLIRALASRYDGHPYLDHVDIGSVGRWGEWHVEETGTPMPTLENQQKVVDLYIDNFKKTPLVMNVDSHPALAYAISRGTGWRADCIGDLSQGLYYGSDGTPENHMYNRYPRALNVDGVATAWEHSPVVFETCWNMQYWREQGWDVDYIFSTILEWRVSVLNNKSFSVPEEWWPKVIELQKKMGYRLVLKRFEHPAKVKAGETMALFMDWVNRGVAPCYVLHPLAIQLLNIKTEQAWTYVTEIDITKWLPGEGKAIEKIDLPRDLAPNDYKIRVALLDPKLREPKIKLAIEGLEKDGWYFLSTIKVK